MNRLQTREQREHELVGQLLNSRRVLRATYAIVLGEHPTSGLCDRDLIQAILRKEFGDEPGLAVHA